MKLPMEAKGMTWAVLEIQEHKDGKRFLVVFSTNFGSVEKEFNSERKAVRECKRITKELNRRKPSHVLYNGIAPDCQGPNCIDLNCFCDEVN